MSIKSKAQLKKLSELVKQGKMPEDTLHEMIKATDLEKLPEHVKPTGVERIREIAKVKVK